WGMGSGRQGRNENRAHSPAAGEGSMTKASIVSVVLVALTGVGASAQPKPPSKVYDHVVKATPPATGEHKFRLVVPDGLPACRGILVVGPYSGGDSRDYHEQVWYREFLNLHGFAFLGATNYYMHDYAVMQAALKQFAADSGHPELVNAPYAATGFS